MSGSSRAIIYQDPIGEEEEVPGVWGGHQRMIQPFSPLTRTSNSEKLARCLRRLEIGEDLIERCATLSLRIFIYFSRENLMEVCGNIPMGVAMLQAAQESLKEELRQDEEAGQGKRRRLQESGKEQEEDGSEDEAGGSSGGMSLLSRAASQHGRIGGKQQSATMKTTKSFSDPYGIDVRDQSGMNDMIDVYGVHGSDGTTKAGRMQSSVSEEPMPKGCEHQAAPEEPVINHIGQGQVDGASQRDPAHAVSSS
jgi:hypothetical protein